MILRYALLLTVVIAGAGLLLSPGDAFAHADYESSTPAKDEVVQQPLAQVDVIFTQEVSRQGDQSSVRVFNEANTQVSEGPGVVDDADRTHISAALPADLAPGRYIVRWTTISDEDGDEDEGAFCFYVGVEPTAAQQAECATFDEEEPTVTAGGATVTSQEPGATPTSADGNDDDDGGNSGAVAAVIVGVVIAVAVVGGALFLWVRRSRA